MDDIRRMRAIVRGRVQGVSYRYFVLIHAQELGLAGWARNLPDNEVEVVAQGPAARLSQWIELLRLGPRQAEVESVEVQWLEPDQQIPQRFTIRY